LKRLPAVASDAKANISRARLELGQLGEVSEWLKRELRRDMMSIIKLRQKTGFDKVDARKAAAEHNAEIAVRAVCDAKPRTLEGGMALIRFVDDAKKTADWIDVDDVTDVGAVLYRAFDALQASKPQRARRSRLAGFLCQTNARASKPEQSIATPASATARKANDANSSRINVFLGVVRETGLRPNHSARSAARR
jgi:hypothetical protein